MGGVPRWPCPQFWKRVTIAPTGDIRFCVVDWLDKSKLGNVRTHSIQEIWKSAEYERLRLAHLEGRYEQRSRPVGGFFVCVRIPATADRLPGIVLEAKDPDAVIA